MSDLFAKQNIKYTNILLIDASGSVVQTQYNNKIIFDHICDIINDADADEFRIIFWNSDRLPNTFFKNGIYKLPFVVKKATLNQTFTYVKNNIDQYCLTLPHLGFEAISPEWINNKDPARIFFVTDGCIGYNGITSYDKINYKNKLSHSIKTLFNKFNNIQLNIITV